MKVAKTIKLFINGEFPRTESGRSYPVFYAKSKNIYANLCLSSRKDFRNAVVAANSAQKSWQARSAYNRSQILYRMAEMTEGKREEFISIMKDTLGMSADKANKMIDQCINNWVYYAGFADKYQQVIGAVNPVNGPHHNFTTPEPVGVVTYVTGEKWDLDRVVAGLAAIICSGNTVVVLMQKHGSALLAPLSEVFATSDLPPGVINLLSGDLTELAQPIASHMEVQSTYYDGQDKKIQTLFKSEAAENMKRVVPYLKKTQSLDAILGFVEYKTVWHPVGH